MKRVRLTALAAADLDSIYLDGLTRFGLRQADRFIDQIDASFQTLAERPFLGRDMDEVRPGTRVYFRPRPCRIVYRIDGDTLHILRVFHGKQDYEKLLTE